jgi:hypothetical protein
MPSTCYYISFDRSFAQWPSVMLTYVGYTIILFMYVKYSNFDFLFLYYQLLKSFLIDLAGTGTGNQSMTGLGATMRSGMIPSLCFSMSDAILFRSMMMHGGSMNDTMGANMTKGSTMLCTKKNNL